MAALEAVVADGRSPIKPMELDEILYWLSESARGQVLRTLRASGWLSYEGESGYRLTDAGRFVATVLSFLRARVREGSLLPTPYPVLVASHGRFHESYYWDTYFAGRAAPLGRDVPAGVVHAIFYNFAPGEAARHIPRVWDLITPEAALAARDRGCVVALRRMLGDLADNPGVARAADLAVKAATCTRTEGRPLYGALRTLPAPEQPLARLACR